MKRRISVMVLCAVVLCTFSLAQMQRPTAQANTGVIPSGTQIDVRMIDSLSSETAKAGDTFKGTLETPVVVNDTTIFPKDADVVGRVVSAKPSGRLSEPGELELVITRIEYGSVAVDIQAESLLMKGESHTKSNATKIGGGTAAGAIIGAIAGGGKGAAIGAVIGAAAGTGVAATSGKKETQVESEAVLSWRTNADSTAVNVPGQARQHPANQTRDYDEGRDRRSEPMVASTTTAATTQVAVTASSTPIAEFTARDRRVIRRCLADTLSLPPGLAKREDLPPGLEKQVQRDGTLPPGLQKRAQSLPLSCEQQLPVLPSSVERVILSRRVLLLDAQSRILDVFSLDDDAQ